MKKEQKKAVHYVDNTKLFECIVEYKRKCKETPPDKPKPRIPEFAGLCISTIAENIKNMRNNRGEPAFAGYSFVEEMQADGIENCIMYFDNFNPEKSNKPFAYFTKIIYYAFLRRIAKEKKQLYLKYKTALNHGIFNAVSTPDSDSENASFDMFNNLVEYVNTYEERQTKKKGEKTKRKPE